MTEAFADDLHGDAGLQKDRGLSPSPAFFKFVRGEDFDPDGAAALRGMYVPADYLRVGIEEGAFETGPQGGFRLGHSNTRYLSRAVFIELVRRGWVGTCRTDRSSLVSDVAALAQEHDVVLALRNREDRSSSGSPGVVDDEPF